MCNVAGGVRSCVRLWLVWVPSLTPTTTTTLARTHPPPLQACASNDYKNWFRVPTAYDEAAGVLTITHTPDRVRAKHRR